MHGHTMVNVDKIFNLFKVYHLFAVMHELCINLHIPEKISGLYV